MQFSHPPRESRGPLDLSPEVAKINEASEVDTEDKQDDYGMDDGDGEEMEGPDEGEMESQPDLNGPMESLELSPDEQRLRKGLRK